MRTNRNRKENERMYEEKGKRNTKTEERRKAGEINDKENKL
jgi:hypothetical protein